MEKTTPFPLRYSAYALSIAGLLISLPVTLWLGAPLIVAAGLTITLREHRLSRKKKATSLEL